MELIRRNTDYALRVLTLMGKYKMGHTMFARDLARKEAVPLVYLHKILQRLQQKGIIKSYRGRFGGGFSLNRKIQDISLLDIMEATQGKCAVNRCFVEHSRCSRLDRCPIHHQLRKAQEDINKALYKITLAKLVSARMKVEATIKNKRR